MTNRSGRLGAMVLLLWALCNVVACKEDSPPSDEPSLDGSSSNEEDGSSSDGEEHIEEGCGDGVLDPGEECDDGAGNAATADSCRTSCQLPACGDGILDSGEECDDGVDNADTADACRVNCTLPTCGDGIRDSDEQCDDGVDNADTADACRTDCSSPSCGDGIRDSSEDCDDGADNADMADACRTDCLSPFCGDGIRDSDEQCDAGEDNVDGEGNNADAANLCRTSCRLPICGDGIVDSGEVCDDGRLHGDGPAGLGESCQDDFDCANSAPVCFDGECSTKRCPNPPLSTEICFDGIDNNCNGTVDEESACGDPLQECERDDSRILNLTLNGEGHTCASECDYTTAAVLSVPCGAVLYENDLTGEYSLVSIEGFVYGRVDIEADLIGVSGAIISTGYGRSPGRGAGASPDYEKGGGYGGDGGFNPDSSHGFASTYEVRSGSGGGDPDDDYLDACEAPTPCYDYGESGSGGGRMQISGNNVVIGGAYIIADGEDATLPDVDIGSGKSGGAGGGVLINARTGLRVSNTVISADGGDGGPGTSTGGGGGGGGRVKIFHMRNSGTSSGELEFNNVSISVEGGQGGPSNDQPGQSGEQGTYYKNF